MKQRNGWNGMKFLIRSLKMIDQVYIHRYPMCFKWKGHLIRHIHFNQLGKVSFFRWGHLQHPEAHAPCSPHPWRWCGGSPDRRQPVERIPCFFSISLLHSIGPRRPMGWLFNSMRVRWINKKHICFFPRLVKLFDRSARSLWSETQLFQLAGLLRWRFEGDDFWWPDFRQPTNIWSQEETVLAQGSQKRWCIVSQVNYNLTKCSQWWQCLWIHFWRWQKCIHMKSWWKLGGWALCSCNFKTPPRAIGTKGTF